MPSISVSKLFAFNHMRPIFSEVAESNVLNFAGVVLAPDKRFKPTCSNCGHKAASVHSVRRRTVRDLPLGSYRRPWLHYSYRVVKCDNCNGIYTESPSVADVGGPRVTFRLAKLVQDLCKLMSITKVAEFLSLDWKTVKNIDKNGLEQEFSEIDYSGLRLLAVDEISYGKYHKYLTIVIDYETGRVVWTGKGHSKDTLKSFFEQMPKNTRDNIEAIAMDMWEPFTQAVLESCPNAAIVYDFYHIVAQYNKVISTVRKQEYHKACEEDKQVIKGSRWMLLKNPENLAEHDKPRLDELLATNESLAKVYILKDGLKMIWSHRDRDAMEGALDAWCELARQADLAPLKRFVKMLISHKEGILAHSEHPIHTSKLEGINNKIKVLKRESYGFHDLDYFSLKIKQRCPGKVKSIN